MAEVVRVVVDAMGGDYAPVEPVKAVSYTHLTLPTIRA